MKKNLTVILLILSFCMVSNIKAASVSAEVTQGLWPDPQFQNTLVAGHQITIEFIYDGNPWQCGFNVSNRWVLSSPDGATWSNFQMDQIHTSCIYEAGYDEIDLWRPMDSPEDYDGISPDYCGLAAFMILGTQPWNTTTCPIDRPVELSFYLDPSQDGKTLILDTASLPTFPWLWNAMDCQVEVQPDWDGPYEFDIMLLPDDMCCEGLRGNVNCSAGETPDVSDIVRLIDYLYLTRDSLCCKPEADCNADDRIDISDIVCMIFRLYINQMPMLPCPGEEATGYLDNYGQCKTFEKETTDAWQYQDCMEWTYDGSSQLLLKHVNAGFNCCPIINANVSVNGTHITIEEIEVEGSCMCLCLFDLDYVINGLSPGIYDVEVIEPYREPDDPELTFTLDLTQEIAGGYCASRSHYPWTLTQVYDISGCKTFEKSSALYESDDDCIEYDFVDAHTLRLNHINAAFNCCITGVDYHFDFNERTITLTETDQYSSGGPCDCICLFDVSYEIINFWDYGTWTIIVEEPYLGPLDEPLEFTVDLFPGVNGNFCVKRNYSPWGQ